MKTTLALSFLCVLLSACGRDPYLLPVRDGLGIGEGAHVLWDEGGKNATTVVGIVTGVGESGDQEHPVLICFELEKEYRETIRETLMGTVRKDPSVAQGPYVLLVGGTDSSKGPIRRGIAIQEVPPSPFEVAAESVSAAVGALIQETARTLDSAAVWVRDQLDAVQADPPAALDAARESVTTAVDSFVEQTARVLDEAKDSLSETMDSNE